MEKISEKQLQERLQACPQSATEWTHYKTGGTYLVVGRAISEATQEPLVLYRPLTGRPAPLLTFARPASEWEQVVEHEGRQVPRFRRV